MGAEGVLLEKWLKCMLESYPAETARFLATENDRFRNPVGHTLNENLATLLRALLGEGDLSEAKHAVDAIVRLRAVQNMTAREALGFIFLVRPLLRDAMPAHDAVTIDGRIDTLAMTAFEEYVRCREQLSELRMNESRRAMALTVARSRGCSR